MTLPPRFRRPLLGAAVVLLADWCLPFGLLNRLFHARGWFPTRITSRFIELLASPGDVAAILVVSASAPKFWVMGALCLFALVKTIAGLRKKAIVPQLAWLPAGQLLLFLAAEVLLPWLGERGSFPPDGPLDFLFPVVPRGHGRAYGWLHLPALALLVLFLRRSDGGHPPPVDVK